MYVMLLIGLITVYREGYIESMSEHVNIHIYGNCGAPCPADTQLGCLQYLARSDTTDSRPPEFSALIGPGPTKLCSHWLIRIMRLLCQLSCAIKTQLATKAPY